MWSVRGVWQGGECLAPCAAPVIPHATKRSLLACDGLMHGQRCEFECDETFTRDGEALCVAGVFTQAFCRSSCLPPTGPEGLPIERGGTPACVGNSLYVPHNSPCWPSCTWPGEEPSVLALYCDDGQLCASPLQQRAAGL